MEEEASRFISLVAKGLNSQNKWPVCRAVIQNFLSQITDDVAAVEAALHEIDDAAVVVLGRDRRHLSLTAEGSERLRFAFLTVAQSSLLSRSSLSVTLNRLDQALSTVRLSDDEDEVPHNTISGDESSASRDLSHKALLVEFRRDPPWAARTPWPSSQGDVLDGGSGDPEDADAAADTLNHALARLFLRLGPPPTPSGNDYAPVSGGDGGVQV